MRIDIRKDLPDFRAYLIERTKAYPAQNYL